MKERTGFILKIIIAIAVAVVGVLVWKEIIPLPLGLVGLFAAIIYYFIDFLIKKKKGHSTEKVIVVQSEKESISNVGNVSGHIGHTTINNDTKPLIDKVAELAEAKALAEYKATLWEENYHKLEAENANRSELPDYKQHALELRAEGKKEEAIESVNTEAGDEEAANRHIFKAELLIDNFQFDEAEQHCKQAVTIFPSYDNNFAIADFYFNLNKFPEAIEYYNRCLNLTNLPEEKADVLNNMGLALWKNNDYSEAEVSYKEALKIFRKLAEENPNVYLLDVAITLNNLAILHCDINEYPKALEEYKEALKIDRKLAEENPKVYLPNVAIGLGNLANLHRDIKEYPKALEEYEEALKIFRKLTKENSKAYLSNIAQTLNNLAILHKNIKEYLKALEEYEEALKIRRKLAEENPKAHLSNIAQTLNNLAILHENINEYSKALEEYEEALKICRKLAEENPKAYLPYVAMILNNLSMFYQNDVSNENLSLNYASEAIEVLGKCNDTPFVRKQLETAKGVIEDWNNK